MINRNVLATRYRKIPGLVTLTIYRLTVNDQVSTAQEVRFVEYRPQSRSESVGSDGPMLAKSATINLWVNELKGWIPREYDVIRVQTPGGSVAWWQIKSWALEMMDTRYKCLCEPTQELPQ